MTSSAPTAATPEIPTAPPPAPLDEAGRVVSLARAGKWLRVSRPGLALLSLFVGFGAGFGAVGFRWLVFAITWLATGHNEFGQQQHVVSLHLPWLGRAFLLLVPVIAGLLYGPLIQRFAPEARGHGVPEVMIAVAEEGGRIRPQVTVVKALASALCMGGGGSVGREGPIVQIGSALASSFGQVVRVPESRLRILVACGAAGAIGATFNAPLTGVFFGIELILRAISVDALFAVIVSSVVADVISRAFFGAAPFFSAIPHGLALNHDVDFLFVAGLGALAGAAGLGFKSLLYGIEDVCDWAWGRRPNWARPAVGGLLLGALLFALPELYGVGYPVMDNVLAGHAALWLVLLLIVAKPLATSLTIGIGGSGGVFAPSLFTGAMGGTAFGMLAHHLVGANAGPIAAYGVVAMGAFFGGGTQAPITAIASVVEMSGDYSLTLPVMLGVGVAVAVSRHFSRGTIYTTKLLRRGVDIDRPRPSNVMQVLTVGEAMQPLPQAPRAPSSTPSEDEAFGVVLERRAPQAVLDSETLEQALRLLALYGPDGLPVLSTTRDAVVGWLTGADVARTVAQRIETGTRDSWRGHLAADLGGEPVNEPAEQLEGYTMLELVADAGSPLAGQRLGDLGLPESWTPVALVSGSGPRRRVVVASDGLLVGENDRLLVLVRSPEGDQHQIAKT